MAVRVIGFPDEAARVETGAVQFGADWPGLFVRGDQVIHLAGCIGDLETILRSVLEKHPEFLQGDHAWDRLDRAVNALTAIRDIVHEEVRVQ